MDYLTLLLVLAGALLHALWNMLAKKASGGLPFVWLFGVVSVLCMIPWGIRAAWIMPHALSWEAWACVAASAVVHIGYSLALQKGYQVGDFSVVYPIARGVGPLCAVCGAMLFLHEWPSAWGTLGALAISIGVFLLARGGTASLMGNKPVAAGVFWGVLTGISIAAYTVIDGWAIKVLQLPPALFQTLSLTLRALMLAPFALRNISLLHQQWQINARHILGVGMLAPLAYVLILIALQHAPLSTVAPLREIAMLLGVVLGALVLREKLSRQRWLGAGVMLAGAVAIASGW